MGGRLEFVDLQHELKDKGIDWDLPICCDSQKSNYSFLRVQMRGDFSFHREKGVWIARRKMPSSIAPCKETIL